MDKTEVIYDAINEIREILNVECIPINELPELVRTLVNDESKNGLTTAFVFSNSISPSVPPATNIDLSTGLIENLGDDGTQTGLNTQSNFIWMSFAMFDPKGQRLIDGSVPINLKGAKGEKGDQGIQGNTGADGKQGESGLDGFVYRTAMAYATTDDTNIPLKPIGGFGNKETNEVTGIRSDDGCIWVSNSDLVEDKKYRWISEATFEQSGYIYGEGSSPFRLTGSDGKDGKDGSTIEFIYRLLPNMDIYNQLREHLSEKELYSDPNKSNIPNPNDSLTTSKGTDSPSGISSEGPIEVVCSRQRDSETDLGGDWSNCVIGSKGGEDGQDGDGVEYIYVITPKKDNDGNDITSDWVLMNKMPYLDALMLHPNYQDDGFCINENFTVEGFNLNGYDGTDEPSDVGPLEPMEWVSIRKKSAVDGQGTWGQFSEPKLWATYSKDGVAYVTSYVFARSADSPSEPIGGDFFNPNPENNDVWSDSVPDGTEPVGMSMRTFCSDPNSNFDKGWSSPKILSDSPNFQVEYSANTTINKQFLKNLDLFMDCDDPEAEGRADQAQKGIGYIGGDDDTIVDPIWMATAAYSNGHGSDGVLTRIKGEKGDKGENGSSVAIEGRFETLAELQNAGTKYVNTGSVSDFYFESEDNEINKGDGGFVNETGYLYIYSGGYVPEFNSDFDLYWTSVLIKGEPGDSAYLYFAYADEHPIEVPGTPIRYGPNALPGKYIGFGTSSYFVSSDSDDIRLASNYVGQKGKGEDGGGQEQIFILTTNIWNPNGNHPPLPEKATGDNIPNYLPSSNNILGAATSTWQDGPQTVSETYPYCWVATRSVSGETFGDWKGAPGTRTASLYSRYSYDGADAISVHLTNDLAVIPMEEGVVDPDYLDTTISTIVQAFSGDEMIESSHLIVTADTNLTTIEGTKVTLRLKNITADTASIPISVQVGNNPHVYTITGNIMMSDTAFEIEPDVYTLRRYANGENAGKLDRTSFDVYLYKGNGKQWLNADVPLFANVRKTDGTDTLLETGVGINHGGDNLRTVLLEDLIDVEYIELFVVQKGSDGKYEPTNTKLSWETISVAADGLNGGTLDVSLYPDEISIPVDEAGIDPDFVILYDSSNPIYTHITVRKEGSIVSPTQVTLEFLNSEHADIFEFVKDENGYETGNVIVKDVSQLYGINEVPIKVVPKGNTSDNRIVTWRFKFVLASYIFKLSESVFNNDPYTGHMYDPELSVLIKKGGGDKFEQTVAKTLYAEINADNGETIPGTLDGNVYHFDFSKYINTKSITLFITSDNDKESVRIKEETLSVQTDGKNAIGTFKTTVFRRTNTILGKDDTPTGGTYKRPIPDGGLGFDYIPANSNEILGSSVAVFSTDETKNVPGSQPAQMTDTANFEVLFGTASATKSGLPSLPITEGFVDYNGWYDNDTDVPTDIGYMATATCKNGEGSDWVVSRIKGERGFSGDSGIVFELSEDSLSIPILENGDVDPDFENPTIILSLHEGFSNITNNATFTCNPDVADIKDGVATINASALTGVDKLTFYAVYNESTHIKTCRLIKTEHPYELKVSPIVIKRDENGVLPSTELVTCALKKGDGSGGQAISNTDVTITRINDSSQNFSEIVQTDGEGKVKGPVLNTNLQASDYLNIEAVVFRVNVEENIQLTETISVVGSGKDGLPGSSPFIVNLEPDGIQVPVENGKIDRDFIGQRLVTELSVFEGNTKALPNKYTVTVDQATGGKWDNVNEMLYFDVTEDNIDIMDNSVDVYVSINGVETPIHKILKVYHEESAYRLNLDRDPIRLDEYNKPKEPVSGLVTKWDFNENIYKPCSIFLQVKEITDKYTVNGKSDDEGKFTITLPNETPTGLLLQGVVDNKTVFSEPISVIQSMFTESELADIKQALIDEATNNFESATADLTKDIRDKQQELQDLIDDANSTQGEIAATISKLATKEQVLEEIEKFENDYFETDSDGNTTIKPGLMNETEIYQLSLAALGAGASSVEGFDPTKDLAADNIFTQAINSVLGNYVRLKAEYFEAGEITAEKLLGNSISGLSIYSGSNYNDSGWALEAGGNGKLAGGAITGNKIGDEGQVSLSPNVKMTGNSKDSTFEEIVKGTEINGNMITTGSISADRIDVTNLAVGKLNTTGVGTNKAKTINISGNTIQINDVDRVREVVNISGSGSFKSALANDVMKFEKSTTSVGSYTEQQTGSTATKYIKLSSFEIKDNDYNYYLPNLSDNSINVLLSVINTDPTDEEREEFILGFNANIIIIPESDDYNNYDDFKTQNGSGSSPAFGYQQESQNSLGFESAFRYKDTIINKTTKLDPGKYNVYLMYELIDATPGGSSQGFARGIKGYVTFRGSQFSITGIPCARTDISALGYRFMAGSDSKYVSFTETGNLILSNGKCGFAVGSDNLYMKYNSNTYRIYVSEGEFKIEKINYPIF